MSLGHAVRRITSAALTQLKQLRIKGVILGHVALGAVEHGASFVETIKHDKRDTGEIAQQEIAFLDQRGFPGLQRLGRAVGLKLYQTELETRKRIRRIDFQHTQEMIGGTFVHSELGINTGEHPDPHLVFRLYFNQVFELGNSLIKLVGLGKANSLG